MNHSATARFVGLDLIRSFAILFVITGHFFINADFGGISYCNWEMFLLAAGRRLFSISVPLFLIITGYLNWDKRLTKKYYNSGIKVIMSYLIISLVTIIFLIYHNHVNLTFSQWLFKVTNFTAISYGWYIEMWIGLFLLTPFLNTLWHSLETRQHQIILIVTLLLTALPNFVNRPYMWLLPDFWTFMYPILFFYIGTYIRQYQPIVKRYILLPTLIVLCMVNPIINLILSKEEMTPGNPFAVMGVLIATVFFLGFYRIQINKVSIRFILAKIAVYSLDMYLVSYMFDILYYHRFQSYYMDANYLKAFMIITSCVFFSSFTFAWFKDYLFKLLNTLSHFIHCKL